jgi:hypothetical protein
LASHATSSLRHRHEKGGRASLRFERMASSIFIWAHDGRVPIRLRRSDQKTMSIRDKISPVRAELQQASISLGQWTPR